MLNTGRPISDVVRLPDGVNVCQLADAIVSYLETTSLDKSWLRRQKFAPAVHGLRAPNLQISYDRERRVLSIRGKPDWFVRGEKQPKAVEYMYQQALQGRLELSPDEIFTATGIKTGTGKTVRMQSLFKGNPNWTLYIANPRRGIYTFNLA